MTIKLKYYWLCIKWLWENREWQNTRQKFKQMARDIEKGIKPMREGKV